jgi:radical SAM protein with 4Fe4S-binding SPASM domain
MTSGQLSLILLPTLKCNVECDYCFEDKTGERLTQDQLKIILDKVVDHMVTHDMGVLTIYWQGGEIMTLPPEWFEQAHALIKQISAQRGVRVINSLQSNMVGYNKRWNPILASMFNNDVGTSMDFPNLHRKVKDSTDKYSQMWGRNVREARESGINVGVIALPNPDTLKFGAERFYNFFVEDLGIEDFQVNMPFPGGDDNDTKSGYPLDPEAVGYFMADLADVWAERGMAQGVKLGPIDALHQHFTEGAATLPCIWQDNCAHNLVSIDAKGNVAQCDCWVTSYPECSFGNIFTEGTFTDLLKQSPVREEFLARPAHLMQHADCLSCDYLAICHGGCPVRAYTVYGHMFEKDPYCETYKVLFAHMAELSAETAMRENPLPVTLG